jgi:hypothetical protein
VGLRFLIQSLLGLLFSINSLAVDLKTDTSRFFVDGVEQYFKKCTGRTWQGNSQLLVQRLRKSQENGTFFEYERPTVGGDLVGTQSVYTPLLVDRTLENQPSILTYRFTISTNNPASIAPIQAPKKILSEPMPTITLNGLLEISKRTELTETWTYKFDVQPETWWSPERGILIATEILMESDSDGRLISIHGQDYYSNRDGFPDRFSCTFIPQK